MRWIWIDTFVDFTGGKSASAIKNITRAEEYLQETSLGHVFPPTLMIEGMAQTAGILVGEAKGFGENVILAKIRRAEFTDYAGPGDQLRYEATLESIDDAAAVTSGTVVKNGIAIGRIDLIFSHVNNSEKTLGLPDFNFVFTEQFMNLYRSFRGRATGSGSSTHGR